MLPVNVSCSDSLSECGSIDVASPWLATRSVAAWLMPQASARAAASTVVFSFIVYSLVRQLHRGMACSTSDAIKAAPSGRISSLKS